MRNGGRAKNHGCCRSDMRTNDPGDDAAFASRMKPIAHERRAAVSGACTSDHAGEVT